jgi:uncharacterized protein (DUF2236 family)
MSRKGTHRDRAVLKRGAPAVGAPEQLEALELLAGPNSMSWRVNREAALLLGGGRALLMQVAHPLVAAGVADHSDFKSDPLGRLRRTLDTMFSLTFGSREEALAACERINRAHLAVRGRLSKPSGGFPAGAKYDARDPALLLWVHATLIDTAMLVYQRYVREMSADECEHYYQESKVRAALFGIPHSLVPKDAECFRAYMHEMIAHGPVVVGSTARKLARSILNPAVPITYGWLFRMLNFVTVGLLPPELRAGFGLRWSPARQLVLDASSAAVRALLPLLPDLLRAVPAGRKAERERSHLSRPG